MKKYDTLEAWGIDATQMVSREHHERVVKELNTQVYRAYARIKELKEENTQLEEKLGK
tara:strand:- start:16036 stop:16209 length:174 start_codon:yes stop_codon:yes gene_type:complete